MEGRHGVVMVMVLVCVVGLLGGAVQGADDQEVTTEYQLWSRLKSTQYFVGWVSNWVNYLKWIWMVAIVFVARITFLGPFYAFRSKGQKEFSLVEQTVQSDNKAVGLSFAGYVFAVCLGMQGALQVVKLEFSMAILDAIIFPTVVLVMIEIARFASSFVMMRNLRVASLIVDGNLAAAIYEASVVISAGFIIRRCITIRVDGIYGEDIGTSFMWAGIILVIFVLYSGFYELTTKYDDRQLIKQGNVGAALGLGGTLIAFALIMASCIEKTDSLLAVFFSAIVGGGSLTILRLFISEIVLRDTDMGTPSALKSLYLSRKTLDDKIIDRMYGQSLVDALFTISYGYVFAAFWSVGDSCFFTS